MLVVLGSYADKEGNDIYPSIETLVKATGFGETTVRRHLKHLTDCGLLEYGNQDAALKLRPGNRPKVYRLRMGKSADTYHPAETQVGTSHGDGSHGSLQTENSQNGRFQEAPLGGPRRGAAVVGKTKNPKETPCAACEQVRPTYVIDSTGICADCRGFGPEAAADGVAFLAQRQLARLARPLGVLP
ncbi:helix-turn-helix domain-containing protein [Arthrobacter bambusae]|uniref:helix-turn-helix domain-containing protein n=1 Tax=Arthrobacter bambusae TaxID=1338426 RepID=UPI003521CF83